MREKKKGEGEGRKTLTGPRSAVLKDTAGFRETTAGDMPTTG